MEESPKLTNKLLNKKEIKEIKKKIMIKESDSEFSEAKVLLRIASDSLHKAMVRSKLTEKDCWENKQLIENFLKEKRNKS